MQAAAIDQIKLLSAYEKLCNPNYIHAEQQSADNFINISAGANFLNLQDKDGRKARLYLNSEYITTLSILNNADNEINIFTISNDFLSDFASKYKIKAETIDNIQLVAYLNNLFSDNAKLRILEQGHNKIEFTDNYNRKAVISKNRNNVYLEIMDQNNKPLSHYMFDKNGDILPDPIA